MNKWEPKAQTYVYKSMQIHSKQWNCSAWRISY